MSRSVGNCCFSQPEICSGDHCSASFCATRHRNSPWSARRQGLGRSARSQALLSARFARQVCEPPLRRISRLIVDGDRLRPRAIRRTDRPAAIPREISSRSSSFNAATALQRGAGAIPPLRATIRWTPVLFLLSSAREMANTLCPFFQRSQSSSFCFAVNNIRDVTICHLLIQQEYKVLRRSVEITVDKRTRGERAAWCSQEHVVIVGAHERADGDETVYAWAILDDDRLAPAPAQSISDHS